MDLKRPLDVESSGRFLMKDMLCLKQILLTSISFVTVTVDADFEIGPVPSDAPA
jgi:hypothetical protein